MVIKYITARDQPLILNLIYCLFWMICNKSLGKFPLFSASFFQLVRDRFYNEKGKDARPLTVLPYRKHELINYIIYQDILYTKSLEDRK